MKGVQQFFLIVGLLVLKFIQETESVIPDKQVEEYDMRFSVFLQDLLENLQEEMPKGIPDIGVPPLDPLILPDAGTFGIREGDKIYEAVNLKLEMKDLNITGISKFHVESLTVDIKKRFLNFSMFLPGLTTNGHYKLNGDVMELFPVENDGPFSLYLKEVHIDGFGHMNISNSGYVRVHINDLILNLTFESLAVEFPNLLGNGRYSKFLLKILTNLGKKLFKQFHQQAMREMSKALLVLINKELDQRTVSQLFFGL